MHDSVSLWENVYKYIYEQHKFNQVQVGNIYLNQLSVKIYVTVIFDLDSFQSQSSAAKILHLILKLQGLIKESIC